MTIVAQNRNEQFAEIVSMIQHTKSEVILIVPNSRELETN